MRRHPSVTWRFTLDYDDLRRKESCFHSVPLFSSARWCHLVLVLRCHIRFPHLYVCCYVVVKHIYSRKKTVMSWLMVLSLLSCNMQLFFIVQVFFFFLKSVRHQSRSAIISSRIPVSCLPHGFEQRNCPAQLVTST